MIIIIIIITILIIIKIIYISACAWFLGNERKRKYKGKQKVKSIGYVVGGNELILKTSLKKIQHVWVFHGST